MTREIDPDALETGNLTWEEAEYLRVRGRLPADYEMPDPTEDEGEDEPVAARTKVVPLEKQDVPRIENRGGIDDDDEEDYEVGWSNDQRRAELTRRGLSVTGNKSELIARLRRNDTGDSTDEDQETV
jgi:hypothetical protein